MWPLFDMVGCVYTGIGGGVICAEKTNPDWARADVLPTVPPIKVSATTNPGRGQQGFDAGVRKS